MGITLLVGLAWLLFSVFAGNSIYRTLRVSETGSSVYDKKNKIPDKEMKWQIGIWLTTFGLLLGIIISSEVGRKIAKKYSANEPEIVLKIIDLLPFPDSNGVYVVTGRTDSGKNATWYLQEKGLYKEPPSECTIVFINTSKPVKQVVIANAGCFWRWFSIIPKEHLYIIPPSGFKEGKIVKNNKFIPVP